MEIKNPQKLCLSFSNKNGEPYRSLKTHLGEEKENDNARESTNPRLNSEEYEVEERGGGKWALDKVERVNNNVLNPIRGLIYNLIKKKN